jgi:2-methylisocitrate lyase-like PEP mutase family enzyme
VLGLDEAIERGRRFIAIGADGVFVAGLKSLADHERVGGALRDAMLLSAAVFETPGMPWPRPAELASMGFSQVSYPASLIFRVANAIGDALVQLRRHADGGETIAPDPRAAEARRRLDDAVELERWQTIERAFAAPSAGDARQ